MRGANQGDGRRVTGVEPGMHVIAVGIVGGIVVGAFAEHLVLPAAGQHVGTGRTRQSGAGRGVPASGLAGPARHRAHIVPGRSELTPLSSERLGAEILTVLAPTRLERS